MFESLVDLASGSAWTYALVFAMAALDVLAPILPSESLLVAAATLSASGRWAERQLDRRGGTIIVGSRFIPGGRTATMLTAGMLQMPWPRFVAFDLAAAAIWAVYGTGIGYFGGTAFEDQPLIGVAVALGLALAAGLAMELGRRVVVRVRGEPASA